VTDRRISDLAAVTTTGASDVFPVVQSGTTKKATLADVAGTAIATINAPLAGVLSGTTFPEAGAGGGSFLAFDKATTEAAVFSLGSFVPLSWRTVDLYLETFNFSGGTGNVRWTVNVNSAGDDVTVQAVTADVVQTVFKIGGETYSLNSNTIAGIAKYGATVVVSRTGGDAADTFDADINVSSLHAVRIT